MEQCWKGSTPKMEISLRLHIDFLPCESNSHCGTYTYQYLWKVETH